MDYHGNTGVTNFSDFLKDPRKLMKLVKENKKGLGLWLSFGFIVYAIFSFFSSGDFSFTMTLGSLVQMFGFLLLALKVYSTGSISGLSKNSVICYLICLIFRVYAITVYDGYLPYDASGDLIYRLAEWVSLFSCGFVYYLMKFKFSKSYNRDFDTF